ncbi:MAG: NUDIX domain-containing protein [Nanoarchaeota archaeon]|nr:NUDIX domain-containing protein [Nanoarchaeota archaeon]MBU1621942.1 NUDIX domain-containing protein [Nanoarchaeota archaeon]
MIKSAGIILFREKEQREYLILRYSTIDHYWGFAKGKIELNETAKEAAIREVEEETGLTNIKLITEFKENDCYSFKEESKTILKEVTWFLGKVEDNNEVIISHEHEDFKWLNYREALKLLSFKKLKDLLQKAETKLSQF